MPGFLDLEKTLNSTKDRIVSTYYANVVQVKKEPHPDAETLSIMRLESGNVVVLRTQDWVDGELAIHVEPDYEVMVTHPAFSWLAQKNEIGTTIREWERVKTVKLRGVTSYGLLAKISDFPNLKDVKVGDNVFSKVPVKRWQPPQPIKMGGNVAPAPGLVSPKYDVESYPKYYKHFEVGEPIVATEKLHGSNGRFVFDGTKIHCGSRTEWKAEDPNELWWRALANTPGLKTYLLTHPRVIVYGEVYGCNPGFRYGCRDAATAKFAAFDLLLNTTTGPQWADWDVCKKVIEEGLLPWVPIVYEGGFDLDKMKSLSEGPTKMVGANIGDIREGIVVKPIKNRSYGAGERLQVKFVSNVYLSQ